MGKSIRKVFGSADRLPTSCVRPRRIVSTSLQSHQLNLLVIASFTDRNSSGIKDRARNRAEFWPIMIVSDLLFLCLHQWRLYSELIDPTALSYRFPREYWGEESIRSPLSIIADCYKSAILYASLYWRNFESSHDWKYTFLPRLRRPECPAGMVLVHLLIRCIPFTFIFKKSAK